MKQQLERLTIEKADNGFTLSKHYKSIESGLNKISRYIEPDKTVHESAQSVLAEVKKALTIDRPTKNLKLLDNVAENTSKLY